jgi:EAL and modified HD-GYP domain-containing signal transduction protein
LVTEKVGQDSSDLFLVGLLSLMDAILELPMGLVLDGISVNTEVRAVLLGEPSKLSPIYNLMLAQEAGEWDDAASLAAQLRLPDGFAADTQWNAMQWANQMTSAA